MCVFLLNTQKIHLTGSCRLTQANSKIRSLPVIQENSVANATRETGNDDGELNHLSGTYVKNEIALYL